MCPFSDFKNEITCRHVSEKKNFPKDGPPSSMVLLVFLESENLLKIRQFPNWEICLTGHDIHMGVWGIIWGAWWCGFYLGRLAVTVAGCL